MLTHLGGICGDKCFSKTCICNKDEFQLIGGTSYFYCCTQKNVTCTSHKGNVTCPGGQKLNKGQFCEQQGQCPTIMIVETALKSNCSNVGSHYCPGSLDSTKICMDKINASVKDYCGSMRSQGQLCPPPSNGLEIEQCYSE